MLFGVQTTDETSFVLAPVPLLLTAFLASLIPVRRAASVQPASALGEFRKVISAYRKGDVLDKTLYDMAQAFLQVRSCNDAETALKALLKNHKKSPLFPKAKKELRKVRALGPTECADR